MCTAILRLCIGHFEILVLSRPGATISSSAAVLSGCDLAIGANKTHNPSRIANYDAMRVLGALAVVCVHVASEIVLKHGTVSAGDWVPAVFAVALCSWAVPVFVMITGAFVLPACHSLSPIEFYSRKLPPLLLIVLCWSAIYLAFAMASRPELDVKDALKLILRGEPYYHLWYVYMLLGLSLSLPFLARLVHTLPRRYYLVLLAACFIVSSAEALGETAPEQIFAGSFAPFVTYCLLGDYLKRYPLQISPKLSALVFVISVALTALAVIALAPQIGTHAWRLSFNAFAPNVVLISVAFFTFFQSIDVPLLWSKLARYTLGCYLIHVLVLESLGLLGVAALHMGSAVGVPIMTMVTFALSMAAAMVLGHTSMLKWMVTARS